MKQLERNEVIGVIVGIAVVVILFMGYRIFPSLGGSADTATGNRSDVVDLSQAVDLEAQRRIIADTITGGGDITKLLVQDLTVGEGEEVVEGSLVTVHYIGQLQDGTQFDNSFARGEPYTFTIGRGDVIAGWDEGLLGMRQGGERVLIVPAEMAYGSRGVGTIPPNSTLIFAVELLEVR